MSKKTKNKMKTQNRAWLSMIAIVLLFAMWMVTSYAFASSFAAKQDNMFETAYVRINLNNGESIFNEHDLKLNPGSPIAKDFIVQNESSVDIYYRLYLQDIEGSLQEVLSIDLYEGEEKVYSSSTLRGFNYDNPYVDDVILEPGEVRHLTAVVTMDKNLNKEYAKTKVVFDMQADAVQSRNNPDKIFENIGE